MKLSLVARILPSSDYVWYSILPGKQHSLITRNNRHVVKLDPGMKWGLRKSTSGKEMRIITEKLGPTIVFTPTGTEIEELLAYSQKS